jgi:excisionase family DNA binding protein
VDKTTCAACASTPQPLSIPPEVAAELADYIDVATAAELLDLAPGTVRDWIKDDRIPVYKLGNHTIRIKASDLLGLFVPKPRKTVPQPIGGTPVRRGPGRPRKHPVTAVDPFASAAATL